MSVTVRDILAPLDSHCDRIVRTPMSSEQIKDLQKQVGVVIPELFKDYLAEIGLFQDLTPWGHSPIQMYETVDEFVSARRFVSENVKPKAPELFPFGGDGAGNEFCLPTDPSVPCRIHFFDHETGKVSKKKDFTVWLEAVVKKVLRGIRKIPLNARKVRNVQYSLGATSFPELMKLLASVGDAREIDAEWMNKRTTSAEVTSLDRQIAFNGEVLTVQRLEYDGWDAPRLYFDMSEPVLTKIERSQIRKLNALFKGKCPGYRLVDYGPQEVRDK